MSRVRYALIAFWVIAALWLGIDVTQETVTRKVMFALLIVTFSSISGYYARMYLEEILIFGRRMLFGLIFLSIAMIGSSYFRATTLADEEPPHPPKEELTFNPKFLGFDIKLPRPPKEHPKGDGPLDKACDKHAPDDPKCACVMNAVFKHDSSWMTAGVGKKALNPCNMRIPSTWNPSVPMSVYHARGNGTFAKFNTAEDGITACVQLYSMFYKDRTASDLVDRWTNGGGNADYRSQVASCY